MVATTLRVVAPTTERLAKLASFIPYGLVFWLPVAALLGVAMVRSWRHRSWGRPITTVLGLAAAAGLVATLMWEGPAFMPDGRAATTPPLRLVSLNVHAAAEPDAVARAAAGADIAVFVEATHDWTTSLPKGFRKRFPYQAPAAHRIDGGSVIFSRYPISTVTRLPDSSFQQWAAIVDTPQLGRLRVVGVHPCNPYCDAGLWAKEAEQLRSWLASRNTAVPTVVAGDFNAVDDHITMRALYDDGFRSAADLAGAGFVRTWPADRAVPPLIGIDHVLVDGGLTAAGFSTFAVPKTDHLGLVAVLSGTSQR